MRLIGIGASIAGVCFAVFFLVIGLIGCERNIKLPTASMKPTDPPTAATAVLPSNARGEPKK